MTNKRMNIKLHNYEEIEREKIYALTNLYANPKKTLSILFFVQGVIHTQKTFKNPATATAKNQTRCQIITYPCYH